MQAKSNNFVALADIALANPDLRMAVAKGTLNGHTRRTAAMSAHGPEHEAALRKRAGEAKRRALSKLPELLEIAESNLTRNGFKVLWAQDAREANQTVLEIARRHNVRLITKSKSMVTEEIRLNHAIEDAGIRVVETDLGEFIAQLNKELPSHITAPIIHKTKAEIRDILVREIDMEPTDNAGEMVAYVRKVLRKDFLEADMGISGGNFIIAESGSLGLVMNEGNGRMVTSMPDVHVAIVGLEKVIETLDDYALLSQLLPLSNGGQQMPVYTNIINGPRRSDESDGPEHVYIILLDNGRSDIYDSEYTQALACIRCGACFNACPVYRSIGGHAYGSVYGGPIGSVLTPLFVGVENAVPLPSASSLCGSCKQVCPVDIDIPQMLLALRSQLVRNRHTDVLYDVGIKAWKIGNQSPVLFEFGGKIARTGQRIVGDNLPMPLGNWTKYRDFPAFAPKSFRQLWREKQKGLS